MLPEHFFFQGEFWISRYFYGHFNVLFQILLVFGGVLLLFWIYRRKECKKTELAAIIVLLSANILFATPCLCAPRWQARELACRSNIKQIGWALSAYAEDNNGHFPNNLHDLKEYTGGLLFICPGQKIPFADTLPSPVPDYLYRGEGKTLSDLPTLLLEDKPRNHPGNVRHHYYGDGIIVSSRFGEQPVAPAKK